MSLRRRGPTDFGSKLHMDRQPTAARITDPSLPAGKRREIDNVMKKARANTNDYWDKKLLEMEEKDPNRWRHSGYKKMYIEGELSSGESDRDGYRGYSNAGDIAGGRGSGSGSGRDALSHPMPPSISSSARYGRSRSPRSPRSPRSRSRSRLRKSPPLSPLSGRRRSPLGGGGVMSSRDMHLDHHMSGGRAVGGGGGRMSPPMHHHSSYDGGLSGRCGVGGGGRPPRSPPERGGPRSPNELMGSSRRAPNSSGRPRSPPEPPVRRRTRSPVSRRRISPPSMSIPSSRELSRRRSPPPLSSMEQISSKSRNPQILPRSKRPPSPPPPRMSHCRSRSNSSVSSCSDDSCSVCSPSTHQHHHQHQHPHHRRRSRSVSVSRSRGVVGGGGGGGGGGVPRSPPSKSSTLSRSMPYMRGGTSQSVGGRGPSPPPSRSAIIDKYNRTPGAGNSMSNALDMKEHRLGDRERSLERRCSNSNDSHVKVQRSSRHSPLEDPRLKNRPPEPPEPSSSCAVTAANALAASTSALPKKKKKKSNKEIRTRIKIEGEKRKKHSSSDSDDSGGSDSDELTIPTFTATTRLTLSERFGKMAQWSIDRSNMENMRITKDSTGGALKVMIAEGLGSPPRRYSYSPAPVGHFPEELATTAPSGMLSWDDVRVRYDYYKSCGYLRDLDLKDYIKWEEWWYKYQEWLKHERYYEYWERQQMMRRRRKKLPISQRLN